MLCVAVGVVTFLLAIKKVLNKMSRDYKPSPGVEQITLKEFNEHGRDFTRNAVEDLQKSQQYTHLEDIKGQAPEQWNWQIKERSLTQLGKNGSAD